MCQQSWGRDCLDPDVSNHSHGDQSQGRDPGDCRRSVDFDSCRDPHDCRPVMDIAAGANQTYPLWKGGLDRNIHSLLKRGKQTIYVVVYVRMHVCMCLSLSLSLPRHHQESRDARVCICIKIKRIYTHHIYTHIQINTHIYIYSHLHVYSYLYVCNYNVCM